MYTVSQWYIEREDCEHKLTLRYAGDWQEKTMDEAYEAIASLKISGAHSVFIIENESGVVEEVIHHK